jgi:Bacterial Ig-like domain (group 2)
MRTVRPIVYASVVGLLLACSDSTGPSEPPGFKAPPKIPTYPAGAFQVSPSTATLQSGQTFRFTTTYSGDPALIGIPGDRAWYSSDEKVATVSGGLVRAIGVGQARIVVLWGGYQADAVIHVVGPAKKQ